MLLGKPTFFAYIMSQKQSEILQKKKTGDCLIHLSVNKPACKIGAVLAMFNFSQKSQMAFFHLTLLNKGTAC